MSRYPDETGAWWTGFPGSDGATWSAPAPPSEPGLSPPAREGTTGVSSRRALRRGLVVSSGKRERAERARRELLAERRRQTIARIREPSLKSGVITVGSGFGGTGKTDVAVTLAAVYAAVRPADRVILADSNDDMPHGYIRLGGTPVETLPQHQRTLSIRGFYQACLEGRIRVYADLRDAVAWLQGVAVIRGDTADEHAGLDFGEKEYLTVLEFMQCMSNIVVNDGGTGLFAKLQIGTLLHGDKYVFVTEASQLGFWSIDEVFRRYRNYEGERDRPLTKQERKHLTGLMDEATIVVNKFVESDPEQVKWHARICESVKGTRVSVAATPWDQALANRVPLDLSAVAPATLDAKLAMAELVLRGTDRANRRRQGFAEEEPGAGAGTERETAERHHRPAQPPPQADQEGPAVRILPGRSPADGPAAEPDGAASLTDGAAAFPEGAAGFPDSAAERADGSDVRTIPAQPGTDGADPVPGTSG